MSSTPGPARVDVRATRPEDCARINEITRRVYGTNWPAGTLEGHQKIFPEGQLVAVERDTGRIVGFAASLIIQWDEYEVDDAWRDFTDAGHFTNHDPVNGHTLYGAEVMVDPDARRLGIGSALYGARRELVRRLGLWRIRAHSRLAGYHRVAERMSARDYVRAILRGELTDPTLSFQLRWGFEVLAVVSGYLRTDPESLGYAALIEWVNEQAVPPGTTAHRRFE